jgi:alkylation response protein AidB-like acyl-CoA dehydrogenase
MNLDLTPEERAFQDEVRTFLEENLTAELRRAGRRTASAFSEKADNMAWHKILYKKGWVAPHWPVQYGGTGWNEMQRSIWAAESVRAGAPSLSPMGLRMVGPVIMGYGTPEQKAFYLPRILSGEDYWCQGYSEPGSGSDLASLKLQAVRDGDDYVLNGSKIWTTHAHYANRMFCLIRTSSEGKPQTGITFVLLEMATPGISVRPIITLAGDHEVNQVFFDNVRVPVSGRIGAENDGWTVAKYLLEFERGGGSAPGMRVALDRLKALAREETADGGEPLILDPAFRAKIAAAETALEAVDMTERRVLAELSAGKNPGPASSMLKCVGTEMVQHIDEIFLEGAAHYGAVYQKDARMPGSHQDFIGPEHSLIASARYLNNRAASIYGGSNQVQRNIMARLVLGLP